MKTRLLIVLTCGIWAILSFNLFSKETYTSPKLKLDKNRGQTVIIDDQKWESNYKIEESSTRDLASQKNDSPKKVIKRAPSSDKPESIKYWQINPKLD